MRRALYGWYGGNVWLFHVISEFHGRRWVQFMRFVSNLADHRHFALYIVAICAIGILAVSFAFQRNHGEAAAFRWFTVLCVFAISTAFDHIVVEAMKTWFALPRPGVTFATRPPGAGRTGFLFEAFPSGHAAFAAVLAVSVWPTARLVVRVLLVFAVLLVGLSRVSLGLHFPADVLGGAAVGWFVAATVQRSLSVLWRFAAPKRPVAP